MVDWITVDNVYLDYLGVNYDSRIPKTDYGVNHYKPFFGILFETESLAYVVAVSHPQPRHISMKAARDFVKVFDGNKLLRVINLTFMFLVKKSEIHYLDYDTIDTLRSFSSETEKNDYIGLLKKEIKLIRSIGIEQKAQTLYNICTQYPDSPLARRCLDFQKLESACAAYRAK